MQDVTIRSTLESYRLAKEGHTDSVGDVLVDPREISVGSLFLNILGIPLAEINKIKSTRGQQYKLDQYFKEHSGQLRKAYVEANRDRAQQKDIQNTWKDLQDAKDHVCPLFNNASGELKRQTFLIPVRASRTQ